MRKILLWTLAFTAGFALTASSAFADTLKDAANAVLEAVKAGDYTVAVVLAMVVGVAALRKYGGKRFPALNSDLGGSLLVLVAAFGTTLAATLKGGTPLSAGVLWQSAKLAAMASGGYTLVRRVGSWLLAKAAAKGWIPGWLDKALRAALFLFQPRGTAAIAEAEKAGEAAARRAGTPGAGPTGTLR